MDATRYIAVSDSGHEVNCPIHPSKQAWWFLVDTLQTSDKVRHGCSLCAITFAGARVPTRPGEVIALETKTRVEIPV